MKLNVLNRKTRFGLTAETQTREQQKNLILIEKNSSDPKAIVW